MASRAIIITLNPKPFIMCFRAMGLHIFRVSGDMYAYVNRFTGL